MDQTVLDWLLEDINPEVRLRTLKEYEHLPDNDEKVIACKKRDRDTDTGSWKKQFAGLKSMKV